MELIFVTVRSGNLAEKQQWADLPNHELHLAFSGCLNEDGDQLGVPWAENAMGADGCG